jgi:hypothetical protein
VKKATPVTAAAKKIFAVSRNQTPFSYELAGNRVFFDQKPAVCSLPSSLLKDST